jgi:hypothetical protein
MKHLRIKKTWSKDRIGEWCTHDREYVQMLSQMLIAQSNLVIAKKDSGMEHYIAIVKELESIFGFTFEKVELDETVQD